MSRTSSESGAEQGAKPAPIPPAAPGASPSTPSARPSSPSARPSAPADGLCESCAYLQRVPNTRGSVFFLCRRSRSDPSFPRYPRLPVLECAGYRSASA